MEIKNLFTKGKMNKDLDERLVPDGEYIDALNIRVSNSSGTEVGAIENEKGNTKLTSISTANNPVCIGSVSDEANEKLYWFVVDDLGASAIYEYDNKNDVTTTVLRDTRTGNQQVLGFSKDYKITGANVIYNKENDRYLLAFTDDLNPPRCINIERAKAYGVSNFEEDDINLYKKPPRKAPSVIPYNLSTDVDNSVRDRMFSFAYRYKYLDGEYSALSTFTQYQFYPGLYDLDFETFDNNGMLNQYNAYDVTYNTGDKRVTDIQLCFKSPLSGVVFVIDTINKEENDFLDSVERSYRFTNKKIYRALPDDELNRLYDNVPITALAQDVIEDRLVFGNFETQYDIIENQGDDAKIKIDYEVEEVSVGELGVKELYTRSVDERDIILDFTGLDLFEGYVITIYASIDSDSSGTTPPYFDGNYEGVNSVTLKQNYTDAADFAASTDFTELLNAMTANFVANVVTTSPPLLTTLDYGEFTKTAQTATSITIQAPTNVHNTSTPDAINEEFKWSDVSEFYVRTRKNILSLKTNRNYDFGIVYLDKYGRYSTVIPNSDDDGSDKTNIYIPLEHSVNLNRARVTINHKPPYWADRYKFFVKTNRSVHYNIFATTFYEDGVYRWVLLNGNNAQKVEAGMNLLVKSDHEGPVQFPTKVKVLEVTTKMGSDVVESAEGWLIGNVDAADQPIKEAQGTYMKIKPNGFVMDFDESNYFSYTGKGSTLTGLVKTTLPSDDETGILQSYDGSTYTGIDLPSGSIVKFLFRSHDTVDRDGNEIRYFEQQWVVQNDYTTGINSNALLQFISNETNWAYDSGGQDWTDPNEQFTLSFNNFGRHTVLVRSTETTKFPTERGFINASITIQRTNGVVVFETDPAELDDDFYYETDQVFDIVNGFHTGNKQTQNSSQSAIVDLDYGNCYSFGNGVESISVRDERFSSTLSTDYRPNLLLLDGYKKIRQKNALTYSGSFNENSTYNSINEFNASRGNIKFMDLRYGSIQKIFARETDLVVMQEDQISKVLFGKNILQSPDGSGSLTQIENVLGQSIAYAGEYGIAKNPESFAEYSGSLYFTDALRGAVLRLGQNGITAISDAGMESYFRDNLSQYVNKFNVGGYDPRYNQYVLSMNQSNKPAETVVLSCGSQFNKVIEQGTPYSYEVSIGDTPGTFNFAYTVDSDVTMTIIYNSNTTQHALTAPYGTIPLTITSASLQSDTTATVRLDAVEPTADVEMTHTCPAAGNREVVIMVMNDIDDADKTIINRYRVASGPYYERTDVFSNTGVARNETLIGDTDNAFIPADTEVITMSSYREFANHRAFFNSCSRIGYLVTSSVLTPAQVQSNPSTTFLAQTDAPANDVYQETTGSFAFNPTSSDDILYLLFDYQDGACTPTDEAASGIDDEDDTNTN